MKLRTPQGKEIEATITTQKGKIKVISTLGTGPSAPYGLEGCEIISASEEEKRLLREADIKIKGLGS